MQTHKSLLANASHELRSPLARIRMGLELMGMGTQPSPAFREEISRNIAELDQLIDEILLASRLDARETDMGTVEQVDLTGLAAEECARSDAELDVAAADAGVVLPGVPRLLRRLIRNLLENARRYADGEVRVSVRPRRHERRAARERTAAPASRRPSANASLSRFTACPVPANAKAGSGWAWRWSSRLPSAMAAMCAVKMPRAAAPSSPSRLPCNQM